MLTPTNAFIIESDSDLVVVATEEGTNVYVRDKSLRDRIATQESEAEAQRVELKKRHATEAADLTDAIAAERAPIDAAAFAKAALGHAKNLEVITNG